MKSSEQLRRVVVAIDGTSGSGKSTLAKTIARTFGFLHVDTGAMYRTVTWHCLRRGMDCADTAAVVGALHELKTTFRVREGSVIMLADGLDPALAIRDEAVNRNVSLVAKIPEVRARMVAEQRDLLRLGSLVMEGRDIGSVVFPDTPFKVYVDANLAARAQRRAQDGFADQVSRRDQIDSTRKVSPLVVSAGAFVVDTTFNTPEQTAAMVLAELKRRGL
jgi:cytidylate kinase